MIALAEDVSNLLDNDRAYPCHTNRASAMGHPCTRYLTYMRTSWDQAASLDKFLQGIFKTGNVLEPTIERILSEAGANADQPWRIVGGQQAISDALLKDHQITGHIDGILQLFESGGAWNDVAVCDIKTCSDYTFDGVNCEADLLKDDAHFFKKWWTQLQIYMLGMGFEHAVLIMVRKSNLYEHKAIWFNIDYEEGERQLQRAKEINGAVMRYEHRRGKAFPGDPAYPARINRPKVCNRCAFVHLCNPKLELDIGETFDDAETEALLDRRAELKDDKAEFDRVNSALKLTLPTGELVRCGKWHVHGKLIEPSDKLPYWKRTYELVPVLPTVEGGAHGQTEAAQS